MSNRLTAARMIKEEQFRLVKEYPAVIRVYENIAGDCVHEVIEPTTGKYLELSSGDALLNFPKNRNSVPDNIAYLDFIEDCGSETIRSYRKNRNYPKKIKAYTSGVTA